MVSINSKSYYLEKTDGKCCLQGIRVVGINALGQTIYSKNLGFSGGWLIPKKLIRTNDKCLFVYGLRRGSCDYGGARDFITKLDTLGTVIFQGFAQSSDIPGGFINGEVRDIAQHPDSSFYLVSDSMLFHFSKSGQFVSKINSGMKAINSFTTLANGNLLLNGKINNTLKNVEMTVSAMVVNQQSSGSVISKFTQTASGKIYALTSLNFIERYNSNLQMINYSIATFTSNCKIKDYVTRNDSVFATGYVFAGNKPFYAILDQNLNTLYYTQANYKNIVPMGIALTNQNNVQLITLGTSATSGTYINFKSLYQLPIAGSFVSKYDIGVTKVELNALSYNFHVWYQGSPNAQFDPHYNFKVTVKNYGNDTVKSSFVNYEYYDCSYKLHTPCPTILPHDSVTINTGWFDGLPVFVSSSVQPTDIIPFQVCFFTTVPNASNDIEINNDSGCGTFTVTGLDVGIQQNQLDETSSTIYPNPFNNELSVASAYEIKEVTLMNALGETLFNQRVNDKKTTVKNESLSPGFYFVKIETEKGTVTKKVLKN
jgi:hypothetical protein